MSKLVHVQILNPRERKLIIIKAKEREKVATQGEDPGFDSGGDSGGGFVPCATPICREEIDVLVIPCIGIGGTGVLAAPLALGAGRVVGPLAFEDMGTCWKPPDNLLMRRVHDAWFDGVHATKDEDYIVSGGQLCPTIDLAEGTRVTVRFEIG